MTTLIKSTLMPNTVFDSFFKDIDDVFGTYKTNIPYNVAYILDGDTVVSTRVEVALAGYDKGDIKVKVTDNDLQILVDKTIKEDNIKYIHKGIAERSARLSFKLINGHDGKNIKSVFKNGLLTIEIPVNTNNVIDINIE